MIHKSPFPDATIPEVPLTTFVFANAAEHADKVAFVEGASGRTVTYGDLLESVQRFAGGLTARGFGPGQVLAIMAPNLPEYAVWFHGAAMTGGTVTTVNPTYTAPEVHHQLRDAGANIIVTIPMFLDTAKAAAKDTKVDTIYLVGDDADGADDVEPVAALMGEPLTEHAPVDLDATVVLPYSSGTTGLSKGVMLTHRNLVSNIVQTVVPADLREDETIIAVLPFFHIYGMQVLMNCGLAAGATIVTMPRFDLELFLQLHQDHGITRSFVAPPMVVALAKHPIIDNYDLSKLEQVFSGAAPLSAELAIEAGERIDSEVVQGYGMTELSPVSHLTPRGALQARIGGHHRAEHRVAHRRSRNGRAPRHRRRRRDLGARSAGHEGIPQQPGRDCEHHR